MAVYRNKYRLWVLVVCSVAAFVFATRPVVAQPSVAEATKAGVAKSSFGNGCRVFICGHSFHIFNSRYLGPIAELADLDDHETVGSQMIGGSSVTQPGNCPTIKTASRKRLRRARSIS